MITIEKITEAIKNLEEINDQSVSFVLHNDGSGCFEDFWNEEPCMVDGVILSFPAEDGRGIGNLRETINFINQKHSNL